MIDQLKRETIGELLEEREGPCLTLYQPTSRRHPENQQDPIRFGNLMKELRETLRNLHPSHDAQRLMAPIVAVAQDRDFWNCTREGLAVFRSDQLFRVFKLQVTVPEIALVAHGFHCTPLLRTLQTADRYQLLALSRREIRLFEGNRHALDEIDLHADVPRTIEAALGGELTEPHMTVASYGGVGNASSAMHHGHGSKASEVDIDAERFFRLVDRGVDRHHSQPSGLPLMLATLAEHRQLFYDVSHNSSLMQDGISLDPFAVPVDKLRECAWQQMEPHYLFRLDALIERFGEAKSDSRGDDDLGSVAKAAAEGRVETLLVEADQPTVDRLDELGALTLKMGGELIVVPSERMPTRSGVAAIYRY